MGLLLLRRFGDVDQHIRPAHAARQVAGRLHPNQGYDEGRGLIGIVNSVRELTSWSSWGSPRRGSGLTVGLRGICCALGGVLAMMRGGIN